MDQPLENRKCQNLEECIQMLNLLLDNEATPEEEAYMKAHVDSCAHCFKQLELEKEFRVMIRSRLQHKEVPDDLITLIRNKISYSI